MQTVRTTLEALIPQLQQHRTIGAAPRQELEWLAAHGDVRRYEAGDLVVEKGAQVEQMFVVLSGTFAFHVDRGTGPRKVMEWRAGDLTGILPYSRLVHAPGTSITEEPGEVFSVPKQYVQMLPQTCPTVTALCVHVMLDRARVFNASDLQDERMVSLGRLAAGLAHELNNPASAAARNARLLAEAVSEADAASRRLGGLGLAEEQIATIESVRDACLASDAPVSLSPIERADREDAIADWIAAHSVNAECAAQLADTAVTLEMLDRLATIFSGEALNAALTWIATGCTVRTLARDLETTATRINELVGAVKRFTHMDRPLVPEPIAIEQGIRDTATMLGAKARARSIGVTLDLPANLPPARASAELNQVWANLMDNAIDAAPEGGRVTVSARLESPWLVVRVTDNGPGIALEAQARVFEPFFTTKPVGQGTGLGLDIARRILRQWSGEIDFESRPGHTEFRVRVPVSNA